MVERAGEVCIGIVASRCDVTEPFDSLEEVFVETPPSAHAASCGTGALRSAFAGMTPTARAF